MKRKLVLALAAGAIMVGVFSGTALGAQTEPGVPGEPNCEGQAMAFAAQAGKELGAPGIGNLADLAGLSVQEVRAAVAEFCAAPAEPPAE